MKIVIEIEDFSDEETMRVYLENMQRENDSYAADPPDGYEYSEGFGPMVLETPHMGVGARIVGILGPDNMIEPISAGE